MSTLKERFAEKFLPAIMYRVVKASVDLGEVADTSVEQAEHLDPDELLSFIQAELLLLAEEVQSDARRKDVQGCPVHVLDERIAYNDALKATAVLIRSKADELN